MPRGVWKDESKRAAACRKGAAHRRARPRGPYGSRVLAPDVSERMRAIAERLKAEAPLPAEAPATPGEAAARIDAFLGAMDRAGGGGGVPRETSRETSGGEKVE